MAVVVRKEDADIFRTLATEENLESTLVAEVTEEPPSDHGLEGQPHCKPFPGISELQRCKKIYRYESTETELETVNVRTNTKDGWEKHLTDLNVCSQKGLVERFDSTIGAGTVLMPFGGAYQMTPHSGHGSKKSRA